MKRLSTLLAMILLSTTIMTGCASVRYVSPSKMEAPKSTVIVGRYWRFAWGLVPGPPINLEQCGPGGIQKMKVRSNIIDALITGVTVGIVMPMRVKITCAAPPNMAPAPQPAPAIKPAPAPAPATKPAPGS